MHAQRQVLRSLGSWVGVMVGSISTAQVWEESFLHRNTIIHRIDSVSEVLTVASLQVSMVCGQMDVFDFGIPKFVNCCIYLLRARLYFKLIFISNVCPHGPAVVWFFTGHRWRVHHQQPAARPLSYPLRGAILIFGIEYHHSSNMQREEPKHPWLYRTDCVGQISVRAGSQGWAKSGSQYECAKRLCAVQGPVHYLARQWRTPFFRALSRRCRGVCSKMGAYSKMSDVRMYMCINFARISMPTIPAPGAAHSLNAAEL